MRLGSHTVGRGCERVRLVIAKEFEVTANKRIHGTSAGAFSVVRGTAQTVAESRQAAAAGGASEQAWWSSRAGALRQVAPDFARRFPDSVWLAGAGTTHRRDDSSPYLEREAMAAFTTGLTVLLDGIETAMAPDRR